jgi:hypothetical protein
VPSISHRFAFTSWLLLPHRKRQQTPTRQKISATPLAHNPEQAIGQVSGAYSTIMSHRKPYQPCCCRNLAINGYQVAIWPKSAHFAVAPEGTPAR